MNNGDKKCIENPETFVSGLLSWSEGGCVRDKPLHVAEDLEAAVRFLSVFALVEAAEFLTFRDAQAHSLLDDEEDQAGASKAGQGVGGNTDELSEYAVVARHVEDTHGNRTPHAVYQGQGIR